VCLPQRYSVDGEVCCRPWTTVCLPQRYFIAISFSSRTVPTVITQTPTRESFRYATPYPHAYPATRQAGIRLLLATLDCFSTLLLFHITALCIPAATRQETRTPNSRGRPTSRVLEWRPPMVHVPWRGEGASRGHLQYTSFRTRHVALDALSEHATTCSRRICRETEAGRSRSRSRAGCTVHGSQLCEGSIERRERYRVGLRGSSEAAQLRPHLVPVHLP
jgi:hypothetical protein